MLVWHAAVIVSVTHKWFLLEFHGELKNELDSREKTLGGPVMIYRLEGRRILGGISWFLGEQKGGWVVTENPKGRITEDFGRIERGGPLKLAWKMQTCMAGGGGANVVKCY